MNILGFITKALKCVLTVHFRKEEKKRRRDQLDKWVKSLGVIPTQKDLGQGWGSLWNGKLIVTHMCNGTPNQNKTKCI